MEEIRNLIDKLNYYTKLYDEGHPEISDKEWDEMYFKLVNLEKFFGVYEQDSPTQKVNYQVVNELTKVAHNHKMLSLEKTKEIADVNNFLGSQDYIVMEKMDGLTLSLKYENGNLVSAETRGDGIIGEDVLHNAITLKTIPKKINYQDTLIIDGECICKYDDFGEFANEYANPRNFASGSIRLLDSAECSKRNLTFVAWEVIEGFNQINELSQKLVELQQLGFTTVDTISNSNRDIESDIALIKEFAQQKHYPIDGCVIKFNNIVYGKSLGETSHHLNNAIAYKFYDETYETELVNIEWTMGRTGCLTPVAILNPIEVDGTTVSRASLHNISVMLDIVGQAYKGEKVWVYKANQIIPQIDHAETKPYSRSAFDCQYCPICGEHTEIKNNDGVMTLWCTNDACEGKLNNKIEHYTDMKKGLAIKGISNNTIEKLMDWGWISSIQDLYTLKNYRQEWIQKSGFGVASVEKILSAIEESKKCKLENFISAIGIPLIGLTNAKEIVKHINTFEELAEMASSNYTFEYWDTFGPEKADALRDYDYTEALYIAKNYLDFTIEQENNNNSLQNKTFVITGKLKSYKNRDELITVIESYGGKVAGSVSSKTDYLINNDTTSTSAKNKKAQDLNIPIISEEDFQKLLDL